MSHIAQIDLDIKDLDSLKKACIDLGLNFNEDKKTYKWWGKSVGDWPLPQGFTEDDLGKCDHMISVKDADSKCYQVGVVRRRDGRPGYTLLWDFFEGGYGLQKAIGDNGNKLKQAYATNVSMKHARKEGFNVTKKVLPDGRVILRGLR